MLQAQEVAQMAIGARDTVSDTRQMVDEAIAEAESAIIVKHKLTIDLDDLRYSMDQVSSCLAGCLADLLTAIAVAPRLSGMIVHKPLPGCALLRMIVWLNIIDIQQLAAHLVSSSADFCPGIESAFEIGPSISCVGFELGLKIHIILPPVTCAQRSSVSHG